MKAFCLAVLLLVLGGCASLQWTRPGTTPEEQAADTRQCQRDAWRQANWSAIDRTYLYGGLWLYPDPLGRTVVGYPYSPLGDPFGERFMLEARLADACMRFKGYDLTEAQK